MTDHTMFQSISNPQKIFLPSQYFYKNSTLLYKQDNIKEIIFIGPIFNGTFLLVIGKLQNTTKWQLLLFDKPSNDSPSCLKTFVSYNLPVRRVLMVFLLHGGNTIVILSKELVGFVLSRFDLTETDYFPQETESVKLKSGTFKNKDLRENIQAIDGTYIAFGIGTSKLTDSSMIYVFNCSVGLSLVYSFDLRNIVQEHVTSICFMDEHSILAIVTSYFQYIELNISNGVTLLKNLSNIGNDKEKHMMLHAVHIESLQKDLIFAVTHSGLIYDIRNETEEHLSSKVEGTSIFYIWHSLTCRLNKYIYLYDKFWMNIYVYDPLQKIIVYKCHLDDNLSPSFTINWFGNQMYFFGLFPNNEIYIKNIVWRHSSLKHLARLCLLQHYSVHEIKKLNLGKQLNKYIFNEN